VNADDFDALSFDCYGTLIDWETGIIEALRPWVQRTGVSVGDERLLEIYGVHEAAIEAERPGLLYPRVLAEALRRVAAALAVDVSDDEAAAFGRSVGEWPAFADSPDALQRLKERFKLVILSNVDRASFARSNTRLGVVFDLVVTAEDVGAYKPSPISFPALFARLPEIGIERGRLLHVAQSLFHDHEPAARIGLPSVWIDRRHGKEGTGATAVPTTRVEPAWTFPSLAAFADAIRGEQ
jgi:2-haloalkanoic acid dehalogenase type II